MFGLQHNHQCVYGRRAILHVHKPLVSISRKQLVAAPKRLTQKSDTGLEERSETEKEVESIHAVDYLAISDAIFCWNAGKVYLDQRGKDPPNSSFLCVTC